MSWANPITLQIPKRNIVIWTVLQDNHMANKAKN